SISQERYTSIGIPFLGYWITTSGRARQFVEASAQTIELGYEFELASELKRDRIEPCAFFRAGLCRAFGQIEHDAERGTSELIFEGRMKVQRVTGFIEFDGEMIGSEVLKSGNHLWFLLLLFVREKIFPHWLKGKFFPERTKEGETLK